MTTFNSRDLAAWYLAFAIDYVLETWYGMPGPWYVKAIIVGGCLAIPGPQDELLLALVVKAIRWYRKRSAQGDASKIDHRGVCQGTRWARNLVTMALWAAQNGA